MATNKERSEFTRTSILLAAREHFVTHGFENTHTDTILEHAGVSRGALYHHFASKREVFEAVFTSSIRETVAEAAKHHLETTPGGLNELTQTCLTWLRLIRNPANASIILIQGPQVLGWKRVRDIEDELSVQPMIKLLGRAQESGEINVVSVQLTAQLINAVVGEIALAGLHRKPRLTSTEQEQALLQFMNGLRPPM